MKPIQLTSIVACMAMVLAGSAYAKPEVKAEPFALSGDKHNKGQPIEIASDALEVRQANNNAVFSGHVVAIQGDVRLKADKMTVYYSKKAEKDKKPKAKTQSNEQGAIQKIDVDGNVFLSTQEETASGDKGVYDVEGHEIHLTNNVVLTRGKNVLKGDSLVYNFDTGKSVLNGGSAASDTGAAQGSGGKGRVRALFVPENNGKMKKEP